MGFKSSQFEFRRWAKLGRAHYEAPGNRHIREVIVTCSKLVLGQLIQIQVMDSLSDKNFKNVHLYQTIKFMTSVG